MKAIIPVAGEGTRLRPHTYSVPKCLIGVAGKPIIGHILDQLVHYHIHEVVLVVGHLGEQVVRYVEDHYDFALQFVEQKEAKGLGHAIRLTRNCVDDSPSLIVYGDTVFEADLAPILSAGRTAIGVKQVEDWRRFGVVRHEGDRITQFVEKPSELVSDLAIVGINYIANTPSLFHALDRLVEEERKTKGEYQLTDAFQIMLDGGEEMRLFQVDGWYDCGKPETLLDTNRALLRNRPSPKNRKGCVVIPPIYIADNATTENCILGPNVSIDEGAVVENAILSDSIVGQEAEVRDIVLEGSLIGPHAIVGGQRFQLNVGDSSVIDFHHGERPKGEKPLS